MVLPMVTVNLAAVLVAAIVAFVIGGLWYSPMLFGNLYMKLAGVTQKQINDMKKKGGMAGMWKSYLGMFIGTLVMSYVVAHFVQYVGATTISAGIQLGFWLWLGVAAPLQLSAVFWEKQPVKLYLVHTGHVLVSLSIIAAILAVWM